LIFGSTLTGRNIDERGRICEVILDYIRAEAPTARNRLMAV